MLNSNSKSFVPFNITKDEKSWMVSLLYIGNVISPIPIGFVMDSFGRKSTLLVMNSIPIISWLVILFAKSINGLFAARFLIGLWLGISYTIIPIYLGEIAEPAIRGSISTNFQTMIYVGVLWEYVLGPYVSYNVLVILSLIFPILFLIFFFFIPETPFYYLMKNDLKSAEESLRWFRDPTANIEGEIQQINGYLLKQKEKKKNLKDTIFTRPIVMSFIIVSVLSIFQRFSGIGTMMAYGSITLPDLTNFSANNCVIVVSITWVLFGLLSAVLADKFGRKVLLVASGIGAAIANCICGVWFYYNTDPKNYGQDLIWVPFACFLLYGASYGIGIGPIVTTIKGEIFPSHVKAVASGVTTIVMAASSFGVNKMYLPIQTEPGMFVNFFVYSVISFLTIIFTLTVVVETKGKSMEEIQTKLTVGKKKQKQISLIQQVYRDIGNEV